MPGITRGSPTGTCDSAPSTAQLHDGAAVSRPSYGDVVSPATPLSAALGRPPIAGTVIVASVVADVAELLAELLALVRGVLGRDAVVRHPVVERVDADRLLAAQVVQRAVARDPVQPRAHVDRALVGEQRVEGGCEDLLQHVLGVLLGAEHVPAERQQPRLVAGDERLVGGLVALAGQRNEPLVALEAEQRRRTPYAEGWVFECGCFHARA